MTLFHLAWVDKDEEFLYPHIPDTAAEKEDRSVERVCFAETIDGCIDAFNSNVKDGDELYVHIIDPLSDQELSAADFRIPTPEEVFDCLFTREVWCLKPVQVMCIGKIKLTHINWENSDAPQWKWLEEYEYTDREQLRKVIRFS